MCIDRSEKFIYGNLFLDRARKIRVVYERCQNSTDSEVICDTLDMPRHDPAGVATSVKAHRRLRRSARDLYAVPEDCEEETEKIMST